MLIEILKERFESGIVNDTIFKPIDCIDERFQMNQSGLIFDTRLKRIKLPVKINNNYYYDFKNNYNFRFLPLDKAYLMCHSPMNCTLDEYINVLKVHYWDNDFNIPSTDSMTWLIPEGGIESRIRKGYNSIVGVPDYIINSEGILISTVTYKQYAVVYPKADNRYPKYNIKRDNIRNPLFTALTHRLMALAFIPIEGNKKHFFVNHKDGNKSNFAVDNLEWTNHYKNNQHAIESGLRTDTKAMHGINMLTGEIKYFPSMGTVAKEFNTVTGNVQSAIRQYNKDKYIKFKPWLVLPIDQKLPQADPKTLEYITPSEEIYYRVTHKGEVYWSKGYERFPIHVRLSAKILSKYPKRIIEQEINGCIVSSFVESELPDDVRNEFKKFSNRGGSKPIPIKVMDLNTGKETLFSSTLEFAKLLNVKKKTIQRIVNYNNGRYKNFQISYIK